jgi:hypothetical protein
MNNGRGRPIVALDIDGTLGNYHAHFLTFAEAWLGRAMPDPAMINPGLKLWEFMEIDQSTYREIKLAYRQGGLKRSMPVYPNADGVTAAIRDAGAEVWICTTRPYERHDSIDRDTQEWLRRNHIFWDSLLYDYVGRKYSKYEELARQAGRRVAMIVDDLPEVIETVTPERFPYLQQLVVRDQPYNRHIDARMRLSGADLLPLWPLASEAIQIWEKLDKRGPRYHA